MELKSYRGMTAMHISSAKPLLLADLVEIVYVLAIFTAILITGLLLIMLCKVVQHASLGLLLIALSGDIEVNPGYYHVEELKNVRGLKIAHLNVQSIRNKIDLLHL